MASVRPSGSGGRFKRVAIVGGGISGLGAAWSLSHHTDRFDFRLFEARDDLGDNAIIAAMPQEDGATIPFDVSVTACIPSIYRHLLLHLFRFIQGRRRTWHCGAHTRINSRETCLVTGLAAARQLGADYPFDDAEARRTFNYYGGVLYGWRFKKARAG